MVIPRQIIACARKVIVKSMTSDKVLIKKLSVLISRPPFLFLGKSLGNEVD